MFLWLRSRGSIHCYRTPASAPASTCDYSYSCGADGFEDPVMLRVRFGFVVLVGAILFLGMALTDSFPATLSWSPVTCDQFGLPLPTTFPSVVYYWPAFGYTPNGPWTGYPATTVTRATLPDPKKGSTLWYTVQAEFLGKFSEYGIPVSKTTPFPGKKR